jgi:hypothetical protein
MREVLNQPDVEAHQQMIVFMSDEAAEQSVQPFLDLLMMEAAHDQRLWKRQMMALQIVARIEAEALKQ